MQKVLQLQKLPVHKTGSDGFNACSTLSVEGCCSSLSVIACSEGWAV
jgi:hypothetical protein